MLIWRLLTWRKGHYRVHFSGLPALAAYRSQPHLTTGVSPAELLFGRKICTKLPELSDIHVEQKVCDRDNE